MTNESDEVASPCSVFHTLWPHWLRLPFLLLFLKLASKLLSSQCITAALLRPLLHSILGSLCNHRPNVVALGLWLASRIASPNDVFSPFQPCNIQLISTLRWPILAKLFQPSHVLKYFPTVMFAKGVSKCAAGGRKIPSSFAGGIKAERRIKPMLTNPDVISNKAWETIESDAVLFEEDSGLWEMAGR